MKAGIIQDKSYTEERPLFNENGLLIRNVTFDVGESPLKEIKLFLIIFFLI